MEPSSPARANTGGNGPGYVGNELGNLPGRVPGEARTPLVQGPGPDQLMPRPTLPSLGNIPDHHLPHFSGPLQPAPFTRAINSNSMNSPTPALNAYPDFSTGESHPLPRYAKLVDIDTVSSPTTAHSSMVSPDVVANHRIIHERIKADPNRLYQCPFPPCSMIYYEGSDLRQLARHMLRDHLRSKVCYICSLKLSRPDAVTRHIKNVHSDAQIREIARERAIKLDILAREGQLMQDPDYEIRIFNELLMYTMSPREIFEEIGYISRRRDIDGNFIPIRAGGIVTHSQPYRLVSKPCPAHVEPLAGQTASLLAPPSLAAAEGSSQNMAAGAILTPGTPLIAGTLPVQGQAIVQSAIVQPTVVQPAAVQPAVVQPVIVQPAPVQPSAVQAAVQAAPPPPPPPPSGSQPLDSGRPRVVREREEATNKAINVAFAAGPYAAQIREIFSKPPE